MDLKLLVLWPLVRRAIIEKSSIVLFQGICWIYQLEGIKALIIAGVTADVCVHSTLRQAVEEDLSAYIADCISTPDASIRNCVKMILTEGEFGVTNELDQLLDLADLR